MTAVASAVKPPRLHSLDQFRGYTMLGMLLVNFLGGYAACPRILKHTHDYCSYADTIMPQFLFAAGFAMRLSLLRRMEQDGRLPWGRILRRILGLALIAAVWYSLGHLSALLERLKSQPLLEVLPVLLKRDWFQTLMHIAVTSLWIVPVVVGSARTRVAYGLCSAGLHIALSWAFNFAWVNASPNGIDGGPLGFLTWSIPALAGTLAYDAVRLRGVAAAKELVGYGAAVMLVGWLLSCGTVLYNVRDAADELNLADSKVARLAPDPVWPSASRWARWDGSLAEPPFVPPPGVEQRQWNYWMMSQRSGNLSYPTFTAGFSLVVFALFLWLADGLRWQVGVLRTLGTNSLAAYLLHDVVGWLFGPWFPAREATLSAALLGFVCFAFAVYLPCRFLEWRGWYLRM